MRAVAESIGAEWFRNADKGAALARVAREIMEFGPKMMAVPQPGPDQVVLAVRAEDGAKAATVVSKSTLTGIMPHVLAHLKECQAEARRQKENPGA
jgi:hypothetical protein